MEKLVTVSTQPFPAHEEGISMAVQRGFLFRNNPELNKLYKEGYIISSYEPATTGENSNSSNNYIIQVRLVK